MLCVQMKTIPKEPITQKFMRPRNYAKRVDVNWRSIYAYIDKGLLPGHKFAGVVLIDVEEADNILRGLSGPVPAKRKRRPITEGAKAGRKEAAAAK